MNTKFSVTLLAVLIVLLVSLAVTSSFSNASQSADAGPQAEPVMIPATGANDPSDYYQRHSDLDPAAEAARKAQGLRLWSGEVFLSDNNTPDVNIDANQDLQNAYLSEDNLPRRHGGSVE